MSANLSNLRTRGFDVLSKKLGAVDFVRFIRLFEDGSGDYTKEKYQRPDITIDDIAERIYKRKMGII